jgi:hypothetical protein
MSLLERILIDGLILSAVAFLIMLASAAVNPRIWLQDYPKPIQALVPPKTEDEKRLSLAFGIPFMLVLIGGPFVLTAMLAARSEGALSFGEMFLYAGGLLFVFNLFDWLVIDWLVFCTITPKMIVIPGTEGNPAYKDYAYHFRGFLIGTVFSVIVGLAVAGLVWLLVSAG